MLNNNSSSLNIIDDSPRKGRKGKDPNTRPLGLEDRSCCAQDLQHIKPTEKK